MPANIQVILQQDVEKVGKSGELIRVRPGFARNYLLPRQLAVPATIAAVHRIEHEKAVALARAEKAKREAREAAGALGAVAVKIARKAGEDGKLFGSVTTKDIEAALKAQGVALDRRKIHLVEPLKQLGSFDVPVKLAPEVTATLKVEVVAK
ncbi:MAG TPA: 50S ribosomal protein L9 [Polyangiaceae bacterium]|nr:50S ribosomal protein L9 [Polyangiaceae bacterium]